FADLAGALGFAEERFQGGGRTGAGATHRGVDLGAGDRLGEDVVGDLALAVVPEKGGQGRPRAGAKQTGHAGATAAASATIASGRGSDRGGGRARGGAPASGRTGRTSRARSTPAR